VRLPNVPDIYSPEVERERNRTLEIEASKYLRTDGGTTSGFRVQTESADYIASDRDFIVTDTSTGPMTVTLPNGPAPGEMVVVADGGGSWGSNNLTVARNGETIEDVAADLICDEVGLMATLAFDGTTWRVFG